MQATVNTPWGKLRSQSQRRYVLTYRDRNTGQPRIEYRTDRLDFAVRRMRTEQLRTGIEHAVIDTVENQVVA